MSKFYVGQRVRFLRVEGPARRSSRNRAHEGMEAVVIDIGPFYDAPRAAYIRFGDGFAGGVMAHQIEPLVPDGHQPAELTVYELLPFLKTTADA